MTASDPRAMLAQDYRAVFALYPEGRRVLADLEKTFGRNPFAAENTNQTNFNCGALAVLQRIGEQMRLADAMEEPARELSGYE